MNNLNKGLKVLLAEERAKVLGYVKRVRCQMQPPYFLGFLSCPFFQKVKRSTDVDSRLVWARHWAGEDVVDKSQLCLMGRL